MPSLSLCPCFQYFSFSVAFHPRSIQAKPQSLIRPLEAPFWPLISISDLQQQTRLIRDQAWNVKLPLGRLWHEPCFALCSWAQTWSYCTVRHLPPPLSQMQLYLFLPHFPHISSHSSLVLSFLFCLYSSYSCCCFSLISPYRLFPTTLTVNTLPLLSSPGSFRASTHLSLRTNAACCSDACSKFIAYGAMQRQTAEQKPNPHLKARQKGKSGVKVYSTVP